MGRRPKKETVKGIVTIEDEDGVIWRVLDPREKPDLTQLDTLTFRKLINMCKRCKGNDCMGCFADKLCEKEFLTPPAEWHISMAASGASIYDAMGWCGENFYCDDCAFDRICDNAEDDLYRWCRRVRGLTNPAEVESGLVRMGDYPLE